MDWKYGGGCRGKIVLENVLSVQNLSTYYFTHRGVVKAVRNVSFEVGERDAVGLIGESGCGKSTTALSIMRLLPRQGRIVGGRILFRGEDLLQLSDEEMRSIQGNKISMVFQDPMTFLNPIMRVGDQITEVILTHSSQNRVDAKKQAIEMLEIVGIYNPAKVYESYPHQLSGGMRQRILIAIALILHPMLLIADEPTTALDVTIQAGILDLIKDIIKEFKLSLLLITHDLGVVVEICRRVNVMYASRIVEHASTIELFERPMHPYTKGLLESVLSIDEFRRELKEIPGTVPNLMNSPKGCLFHPRCSLATDQCRSEEPPLVEIQRDHMVSCWNV